jgi:hypothetical protein
VNPAVAITRGDARSAMLNLRPAPSPEPRGAISSWA